MKAVLVLLAFVAMASATPLVGKNKCTYGPSYWCAHVKNAKECGAVDHCIEVWKYNKQEAPKATETCLICKGLIADLKTLVESNKTTAEIQTLALKGCKLMHNVKIAQEVCDAVVLLYLPEVIKMLESKLDVAMICNKIGLCSSKTISLVPKEPAVNNKVANLKSQECDECKLGVSLLKNYLTQNATTQEIVTYLTNEICPRLPGELGTLCRGFVASNVPALLKELNTLLDPTKVCSLIGICPKTVDTKLFLRELISKMSPKTIKANPIECDLCEAGITDIRVELRQPNVQKEVVAFLQNDVCPHLGSLKVTCSQVVQQYIPVGFQLIISELDPTTVCTGLGVCAKKSALKTSKMLEISMPKPVKSGASIKCVICEFVMKEIDSLIGTNRSEAAIESALDKVCSLLPATIKAECDGFVQQYTPFLVKLLAQYVQPGMVCKSLGLCAGVSKPKPVKSGASVKCVVCEFVMKEIDSLIGSNHSEAAIQSALDDVCSILPATIKAECDGFVKQYTPLVVKLISQYVQPGMVCKALGLCAGVSELKPVQYVQPKASIKCVICEFVMNKIDALIGTNRSEAAIQSALDKVCSILPATIKAECDGFVNVYTPLVVKLLVQYVDANKVCKAIGLCAAETEPKLLQSTRMISSCNLMMRFVKVLVTDTKMEMDHASDIVCNFVPRNNRHMCREAQKVYKQRILALGKKQLISDSFTPAEFCKLGRATPKKTFVPDGLVHLLGESECTRGPAAWCATYKSAVRCSAVNYCLQRVWKRNNHL